MKKKLLIITLTLFLGCLFLSSFESQAQSEFEIDYPTLPGGATPSGGLVGYLRYLYLFGLSAVGIAGFGALVYGGFKYMLSDAVTSKQEAKSWIWGAITGIILALSAYLILNTINPDLVKFREPDTTIPTEDTAGHGPGL